MVQDKRRRRKKARIDNSSSESSSDESEIGDAEDVKMVSDASAGSDSDQSSVSELEEKEFQGPQHETADNSRLLAHKAPVRNEDFNQNFLGLVTSQFGDDLENLRKAPDFKSGSLELLISGLKQGVNIFDESQKKLLF